MKCPECGYPLGDDDTVNVCPRCLTVLSADASSLPAMPMLDDTLLSTLQPALLETDSSISPDTSTPKTPSELQTSLTFVTTSLARRILFILTVVLGIVAVGLAAAMFISLSRQNIEHDIEQADQHFDNAQHELATHAYLRALEKDENSLQAHMGIGKCYLEMQRPSLAVAHFKQAVAINPELIDAHRELGITYSLLNMYPDAEASLRPAWDAHNMAAGSQLGYVYYQEQRYEEAISILEKVIQSNAQDIFGQEYLGRAFYALDRYDEALQPLKTAVELDPLADSAREYLGLVEYHLGRYDWAAEQFQHLTSVNPERADLFVYLGQCYRHEGDVTKAEAHFKHALFLNQTDVVLGESYLALAEIAFQKGDYTQARDIYLRAVILEPENAQTLAGLGWSYAEMEQCELANPLFARSLEIDPYLDTAQKGLETCP